MKNTLKLTVIGLAGYGAYMLWTRYGAGARLERRNRAADAGPGARRVQERSELSAEEWTAGSDDPVAQATAILTESDERSSLPRTAEGIERRRSEDTVEP